MRGLHGKELPRNEPQGGNLWAVTCKHGLSPFAFPENESEYIEPEIDKTVAPVGVNEPVVFARFQPPTEVSPQRG